MGQRRLEGVRNRREEEDDEAVELAEEEENSGGMTDGFNNLTIETAGTE